MNNQADLRRKLNAARQQVAAHAAEELASGKNVDEDLARLEVYDKVVRALPSSKFHDLYPATLIAICCLLAASIAWTIHVPNTRIHLQVNSTSLTVALAAPINWSDRWHLGNSGIRLNGFSSFELPPELHTADPLPPGASLMITGGTITITGIDVDQNASLFILENQSGDVDIETTKQAFNGQLDISGQPTITARSGGNSPITLPSAMFDPPGTVSFHREGGGSIIPAQLETRVSEKLRLPRLQVRNLSLFTETTGEKQEPAFVSTITAGRLILADTGATVDLKSGDPLYLEDANGLASVIEIGPTGIDTLFDGKVKRVKRVGIGTGDFEQNLTPTILEYVYHRQKLSFFWGAVTFLWGFGWSVRKLFVARRS